MNRRIIHIDINAFFASVEQVCNPNLRGKPIAVIGSSERTVVTTCSYEARAYGVKTGMTKYEAKKLCPEIILVVGDNRKYTDTSSRIIKILKEYTPEVEVFSIDESFLDITHSIKLFHGEKEIALSLKKRIKDELGLLCSIGIAPNKLLAKIASDMKKPDGLVIVEKDDVNNFIKVLPVSDICGIGEKLTAHLNLMGIKTCSDLGKYSVEILKNKFGVIGERLHDMALGIDESPVVPFDEDEEVKSIGHSMTYAKDVRDSDTIQKYLLELSEMVGRRARRYGYFGKTVTLTVRYKDFTTFSKQLTIKKYISHDLDIYNTALIILDTINLTQPVRLFGVSLSNLSKYYHQYSLFDDDEKKNGLIKHMDEINDRFGEYTLTYGRLTASPKGRA
ncbi:MAG: DNA polymerase IV [bacterium]|nr:DNA polymerase IV [bacterium]